ncbi:MAG: hypothetical protein WC614_08460 [bacterium]
MNIQRSRCKEIVLPFFLLFVSSVVVGQGNKNADSLFKEAEQLRQEAFTEADTLKYLKTIEILKTIIKEYPESERAPEAYLGIMSVQVNNLMGRENYRKAVQEGKEMLKKYPANAMAYKVYNFLYYTYSLCLYDYQSELETIKRILELYKDSLSSREKVQYHNTISYAYGKLGDTKIAIKELDSLSEKCEDKEFKEYIERRKRFLLAIGNKWQVRESDHLRIFCTQGSPAKRDIEKVISEHEKAYKEICDFLGVSVPVKIEYFFFSSQEEADEWFGKGTTLNSANRDLQIFALYSDKAKASVKHELTHCIAYMISHHSRQARLELFSEGLAETMVGARQGKPIHTLAASILKDKEISIRDLTDNKTFYQIGDTITYPLAGSFVKYLLDEYGIEKFKFIYKYAHPAQIYSQLNLIFKKTYGKTIDELEKGWHNKLGIQ